MRTSFLVKIFIVFTLMLSSFCGYSQDDAGESEPPFPAAEREPYAYSRPSRNSMWLSPPSNLKTEITYNPETEEYEVTEKVGAYETYPGYGMSLNEYSDYYSEENKRNYWQNRAIADRTGDDSEFGPSLQIGGEIFDRIFGSNTIDIKPQGSVELTFGVKRTVNKNSLYTRKQQRNTSFDFNNKIQMSVTGSIGDKVSMTIKYDTESQFEFDNEMKLEYVGKEDEIIKRIELGNVSFASQNSLITGSQSLFGVKTELQFGKLYVTSVVSQQKGQFSSVESKGGARTEEFEIRASEYDENQHYFLSEFFKENYRLAFDDLPVISSDIIIRKVEVWVSQTSAGNKNARDILALTQLGEDRRQVSDGKNNFLNPSNRALYNKVTSLAGIRDINSATGAMGPAGYRESVDYERFEQAELLSPSQYTVNNQLGYISFRSKISREKSVAVAIEYEYRGVVYRVGEFSSELPSPNALVVKLLKGRRISPEMKNWGLMMRNVYSMGGYQVSADNFFMEILYEDDRTGLPVNYLPEGPVGVKGVSLLSVLDLDRITADQQPFEDGIYDFIEGVTAYSSNGKLFLTKPEPFGEDLKRKFGADFITAEKYVYTELYDSAKVKAKEYISKNKFILKGKYQSSSSSTIRLNATQIEPESVVVTAGGRKLQEGMDYTLKAEVGEVEIINAGLLESGTPIKIEFENNPLFSMQTKSMLGTRLEYRVNPNLNLGSTVLRLKETPLTHKVGFDDFPINNTMWGLDAKYTVEAPFLTKLVDMIPLIETKAPSKISVSAEFAQLIPKVSKAIDPSVEIDYFENTQRKYSLKQASAWMLASPPQGVRQFKEHDRVGDLSAGFKRAHVAWFEINSQFYATNQKLATKNELSDPFVYAVYKKDLFPNYDVETIDPRPMSVINLSYYPSERGQYNFTVDGLDPSSGRLKNPADNWGGIMRSLRTTDFDDSNVEYLEFWIMDPFIKDSLGMHSGGDLVINLGDVSEDVLPDGRKAAENGNLEDSSKYDVTAWGRVPNYYVVEKRFDNANRAKQDLGFDGLSDAEEARHFEWSYLRHIRQRITNPDVLAAIEADPANDNFVPYTNYRGFDQLSIIERYRYINNAEGNSPSGGSSSGSMTDIPDSEDANGNFTLDVLEDYYEYKISIRPGDLVIGRNFVADMIETNALMANRQSVKIKWYQLKIPIRTSEKRVVGNINSFQNIQFMRMYLTGFNDSVMVRFAEMNLVTSSWRKYNDAMFEAGDYDLFNDSEFDVSVVNIEENSQRKPVNYVLPPDISRVVDPMNQQLRELNEQSIELKVSNLDDGNSKAVFKEVNRDYRQFGRIQMFAHAEALPESSTLDNGDLYAFIRIGSDYSRNYYEYEIPLQVTPHNNGQYDGSLIDDRLAVWPKANNFDIAFETLTNLKVERNAKISSGATIDLTSTYYGRDGLNRVAIKGNPDLSNVRTIMMGVRNRKRSTENTTDDGLPKSAIVWFNELRLTDFKDNGGWAAGVQTRFDLADFASVSVAGNTAKAGFGSIDEKVFNRSKEDMYQYDLGSNISLNKFFPEKLGLAIPFYTGVSETFIIPMYDPTNPDLRMSESLNSFSTSSQRDSLKRMSIDYNRRSSFNFTNVRMAPEGGKNFPWSVKNFSASYGYSKYNARNVSLIHDNEYTHKAAFVYNYVLSPKPLEPFKKNVKNKQLTIIRDFNVYYLPVSFSMSNDWNKKYREIMRRNFYLPDSLSRETYSKNFDWDRTYNLKYNFSQGLKFDYTSKNQSRIDEPYGKIDKDDANWDSYKSDVVTNTKKFGMTTDYNQTLNATYRLPINKIQPLSWVTSNYRYSGNYNWARGAETKDTSRVNSYDSFTGKPIYETYSFDGHNITNSNNQSIDANMNMMLLYRKNDYLKSVDRQFTGTRKSSTGPTTTNVKFTKEGVGLKSGKTVSINHRLGTEDVKLNIVDSKGVLVKGSTEIVSKNKILFTPDADHSGVKVIVNGKKTSEETPASIFRDRMVYTAMMVKSASINYSFNNGSYIPHYFPKTSYMGLDHPFSSTYANPGWDYVFGYVPSHKELVSRSADNMWFDDPNYESIIYKSPEKYIRSYGNKLALKATLEPISDLKIELDADRSYSRNYTRFMVPLNDYDETGTLTSYPMSPGLVTGNYSISCNSISSAFNSDAAFEKLKANRLTVANRLAAESGKSFERNPETGFPTMYDPTSQDILIPSFIAAYTGQDPNKVYNENSFMPLFNSFANFARSLNWRVSYTGLTKIKPIKKVFKRISINHQYKSNYSIGNYQTFTGEVDEDGFFVDAADGSTSLAPEYEIASVSISERFSPLFGIDMRWANNFTSKFEVKNSRTVTLAFANSEISENGGWEYVFGCGYVFKDFALTMNTANGQKTYKNDLTVNGTFSVRDNLTVRRNIVQDVTQKISGQKIYSFKSYAEYALTERFTARVYLDHDFNKPVTNGNPTSNSKFGVTLRFILM